MFAAESFDELPLEGLGQRDVPLVELDHVVLEDLLDGLASLVRLPDDHDARCVQHHLPLLQQTIVLQSQNNSS